MGSNKHSCNTVRTFVRMCMLLARFNVQKKLLEKSEKFNKFERVFSGPAVYTIYAASLVVMFVAVFAGTFAIKNFYSTETKNYYECIDQVFYNNIGLNVFYFIIFTIIVILLFLAKVTEKLGMGWELKLLGVVGVVLGAISAGFLYLIDDPGNLEKIFSCQN